MSQRRVTARGNSLPTDAPSARDGAELLYLGSDWRRLGPELRTDRTAQVIIAGLAFLQNLMGG